MVGQQAGDKEGLKLSRWPMIPVPCCYCFYAEMAHEPAPLGSEPAGQQDCCCGAAGCLHSVAQECLNGGSGDERVRVPQGAVVGNVADGPAVGRAQETLVSEAIPTPTPQGRRQPGRAATQRVERLDVGGLTVHRADRRLATAEAVGALSDQPFAGNPDRNQLGVLQQQLEGNFANELLQLG